MLQFISRFGVDIAIDWLIKNNHFYKNIKKDENWHVLDPNDPEDQLFSSLMKKDEAEVNEVKLHEDIEDDYFSKGIEYIREYEKCFD